MVFHGGGIELNPNEPGCISRSCTQHQGGRCSKCECRVDQKGIPDKRSTKALPNNYARERIVQAVPSSQELKLCLVVHFYPGVEAQ